MVINGITYRYAISFNGIGELYEYWFDTEGNLVWVRHHSNHKTPHKHENPHDHRGKKDDKGNNTIEKGPLPVDKDFHSPEKFSYQKDPDNDTQQLAAGVATGIIVYEIIKWVIATVFAPATGGASYGVAAATP